MCPNPGDLDIFALSRGWRLRVDHGRGLVYKFTQDEARWLRLGIPETVALILCDGHRRFAEVVSLCAQMLGLARDQALKATISLVDGVGVGESIMMRLREPQDGFVCCDMAQALKAIATGESDPLSTSRLEYPLSLLLVPTYVCHTDCIYCYAERPRTPPGRLMSPGRWVELLREAGDRGLDLVTFSGGDPLAYREIDRLLAVVEAYGMDCVLPTKSFVSAARAQQLAGFFTGGGYVQISVDSLDPEVAAAMTMRQGYAECARASIRNLLAAGVPVRTNTVVTPLNLGTVERLLRELRRMGVSRAYVTNYGRSYYRHRDELFLSPSQTQWLTSMVEDLKAESDWSALFCNATVVDYGQPEGGRDESWGRRSSCSGGFSSCAILPDGDVILCEQVPHDERFVVGNLKETSLSEVWSSPVLTRFIVPDREAFTGTPCAECGDFDPCHRVFGRCFRDAYFSYGRIFAPSPMCPRAEPGIRMS